MDRNDRKQLLFGFALTITIIAAVIISFSGCGLKRPLPTEPEWPVVNEQDAKENAAPSHRRRLVVRSPIRIASVNGQAVCLTAPAPYDVVLAGGKIGWIFAYATVKKGETCATFSLADPRDASTSIDAIWLGSIWGGSCCNADQTIWRREGTP